MSKSRIFYSEDVEYNAQQAAKACGAWVKTPGLQPDEPNALNYLDLAQLEKLKTRVDRAIRSAEEKALSLANMHAGNEVRLTRSFLGLANGITGVVVQRYLLVADSTMPDDYVPVAWRSWGLAWVPIGYLRLTNGPQSVGFAETK